MADLELNSQPLSGPDCQANDPSKKIKNAAGYSQYVAGLHLEFTDSEERRTRWKIDLVIIPIFLITQACQHTCRTTLNYVNLFGYQEALRLHGNQFNYLSAMVYAGYFFGQYPCGWLIGRFPAQKVLSCGIMGMGVLTIVMTQCRVFLERAGGAVSCWHIHGLGNPRPDVDDRVPVHAPRDTSKAMRLVLCNCKLAQPQSTFCGHFTHVHGK